MLSSEDDGESYVYENPFFQDDNEMVIGGDYRAPAEGVVHGESRELSNKLPEGFYNVGVENADIDHIVSNNEGENSNQEFEGNGEEAVNKRKSKDVGESQKKTKNIQMNGLIVWS